MNFYKNISIRHSTNRMCYYNNQTFGFMVIGLGIDTGGTYTDSVVMDTETKEIICRSKALTTRDDLIKGIVASLKGLSKTDGIQIVSLSSTLATNSIVEGKSCRVGLIVLGKKFGHTVNVANYAYAPNTGDVLIQFGIEESEDSKVAVITLIDEGVPYNPLSKADPDITLSAEDRQIGGLGIYMVKKSMDSIEYSHEGGSNKLTIRKKF